MISELSFSDRLANEVRRKKSVACVGLDPRSASLPGPLKPSSDASPEEVAESYRVFCREIIDVVAPLVPVVKPQAAFFEQIGPFGMLALADVIQHASNLGLIVILDGKRNDIGTTAEAYAEAYLGSGKLSAWGADSLTVSPYLGEDSLEPFVERCDKTNSGLFVLVKTSNPGGGWLQDRPTNGITVSEHVANLVQQLNQPRLGECGYGPVGAVVGATYPAQLRELRARMSTAWILIPGFGAQGGAAEDVRDGFDSQGLGAIVNSSRGIIFAHQRADLKDRFGQGDWQRAVEVATLEMNEQLNSVRAGE